VTIAPAARLRQDGGMSVKKPNDFVAIPPQNRMKAGDRVCIVGAHPWTGEAGEIIAFEEYGLGWRRWRVRLDVGGECYAPPHQIRLWPR